MIAVSEEYYDAIVIKETKKIPVDKIQVSKFHVRQHGISKGLEILAKSIHKIGGLISPVVVYEIDGGMYELIVGQRRYLAHQDILKWKKIMAMIIQKPASDKMATTISWLENEARQKMSMKDKMKLVAEMYAEKIPIKDIMKDLGMKEKDVKGCVKLPRVPDVVREAVQNGEISPDLAIRATDAKNFDKFITDESEGDDVLELAKLMMGNKLTVSQLGGTEEFGTSNPDASNGEIIQGGIDNSTSQISVDITSSDIN
jgi:ParB/RepB/Spo0J family partition protein